MRAMAFVRHVHEPRALAGDGGRVHPDALLRDGVLRQPGPSLEAPTDTGITSAAETIEDRLEDLLTAEDEDLTWSSGCSGREP